MFKRCAKFFVLLFFLLPCCLAFSGELINSHYDDYFEYLELTGRATSPHLSFRAFSNNDWQFDRNDKNTPWYLRTQKNRVISNKPKFDILLLDPELFLSYNSTYARGYNDGAMWQGKGMNTSVFWGMSFRSKYFTATFAPYLWLAQNQSFDIVPSAGANEYGYFYNGIDYPQRFGSGAHIAFDLGQTDIRVNVGAFTVGVSNENFVIGPSRYNSLLMNNNAAGFPHIDLGFNKTENILGVFELRLFWGLLSESDYFDEVKNNDYTYISGFSFSYSFPFLKSLTLSANRVVQTPTQHFDSSAFFAMYDFTPRGIGSFSDVGTSYGYDKIDQKMSLSAEWKFSQIGFNVYFEYFKEDYTKMKNIMLIPEHAAGYMFGIQQVIALAKTKGFLLGAEHVKMQQSRDYELYIGPGGTYFTHGVNIHGYTNKGQLLGSVTGPGENAQFLSVDYYNTWGKLGIEAIRIRHNMDYVYRVAATDPNFDPSTDSYRDIIDTEMSLGTHFITFIGSMDLYGEFIFSGRLNTNFIEGNHKMNVHANLGIRYRY